MGFDFSPPFCEFLKWAPLLFESFFGDIKSSTMCRSLPMVPPVLLLAVALLPAKFSLESRGPGAGFPPFPALLLHQQCMRGGSNATELAWSSEGVRALVPSFGSRGEGSDVARTAWSWSGSAARILGGCRRGTREGRPCTLETVGT